MCHTQGSIVPMLIGAPSSDNSGTGAITAITNQPIHCIRLGPPLPVLLPLFPLLPPTLAINRLPSAANDQAAREVSQASLALGGRQLDKLRHCLKVLMLD